MRIVTHMRNAVHITTIMCGLAMLVAESARGVELLVLRFRQSPTCSTNVVCIQDIVEVVSGAGRMPKGTLESTIAPAPRDKQTQSWTSDQVLEHLSLRGVRADQVRWTGEHTVTLRRLPTQSTGLRATSLYPSFVKDRSAKQAESNLVQAIDDYLALRTGQTTTRHIELQVPIELVPKLQSRRNIQAIGGGAPPWEGRQDLVVEIVDNGEHLRATIQANIFPPSMVVVAARTLRQNEVLTADLLTYSPLAKRQEADKSDYFEDIEVLVGKQLRRSVATGVPIARNGVSDPVVIQRGDLVEIEAVSGSISVKTSGRSLGDGAVGESIVVENLSNRKKLSATIISSQRVRIIAAPNRISEEVTQKNP